VKVLIQLALVTTALVLIVQQGRAGDAEQRFFTVTVDGKPAGVFKMSIQPADDGAVAHACQATIQAKTTHGMFHSNFACNEGWKGGKLQHLEASSDVDGKKRQVAAAPNGGHLRVTVNGQRSDVSADVWATTFLVLPAEARRNGSLPLLVVESGKEVAGKLEHVGVDRMTVLGQSLDAAHYRVHGEGIQADLWYDGSDRLMRRESLEDGHKIRLELNRVQR
jgi:hypothetical protein